MKTLPRKPHTLQTSLLHQSLSQFSSPLGISIVQSVAEHFVGAVAQVASAVEEKVLTLRHFFGRVSRMGRDQGGPQHKGDERSEIHFRGIDRVCFLMAVSRVFEPHGAWLQGQVLATYMYEKTLRAETFVLSHGDLPRMSLPTFTATSRSAFGSGPFSLMVSPPIVTRTNSIVNLPVPTGILLRPCSVLGGVFIASNWMEGIVICRAWCG